MPKLKQTKKYWTQRQEALASIAMKKLFLDEPLTDAEVSAIFVSSYWKNNKSGNPRKTANYVAPPSVATLTSSFIFTEAEKEILSYFARHPEMLFSLNPRLFEELIAAIFRNNGFVVELTPQTRDGGFDVIAVRNEALTGQTLHLIECKRYLPENKVGIGVVQRMLGVVEQHRATQGLIVTTSTFSHDAIVAAETSKHRIGLNSFKEINSWLRSLNASI